MKKTQSNSKLAAVLQALLVTFLWSTSWVLIKVGLGDIPPLTFAALRYSIAFLALLAVALRRMPGFWRKFSRSDWLWLLALGLVYYTLTQGTQFLGLKYLPTILFSFMLNFTALITAFLGVFLLGERLRWTQWLGVGVFLVGALIFFYPLLIPAGLGLGITIGVISVTSNSFAAIIGRAINRRDRIHPMAGTVVSMGVGACTLVAGALLTEPFPQLSLVNWGNIIWQALVNTSLAFTLWNLTLRTLTAAESSIINNTMLVQIALLAWLFLGEQPGMKEWAGMLVATLGVVLVSVQRTGSNHSKRSEESRSG